MVLYSGQDSCLYTEYTEAEAFKMSKLSLILAVAVLLLLPAGIAFAQEGEPEPSAGLISDYTDAGGMVHPNGAITVMLNGVPLPAADTAYEGWLVNDKSSVKQSIGIIALTADGTEGTGSGSLSFQSPSEDLLAQYDKLVITAEPVPDSDPAPSDEIAFSASIPRSAMKYIRELLSSASEGDSMGHLGQLRAQTMIALGDARRAAAANDINQIKMHAEAMVNEIEGIDGENYGDHNGDGTTGDNGDGVGLLARSANRQVALVAAASAPEVSTIVMNAAAVDGYGAYVDDKLMAARDVGLEVLATDVALLARTYAANAASLMNAAMEGFTSSNATSGALTLEPGVVHVHAAAQAMATYTLLPGTDGLPSAIGPSIESLSVGDPAVPGIVGGTLIAALSFIMAGGMLILVRRRSRTSA